MQDEYIIQVKDLSFRYESEGETTLKNALDGLSFDIKKGSFVAIIGPNGSGKSTLAKCFNVLNLPTEGDILINGMNTRDENNLWNIRSMVGMVFQNPDNQLVSSVVEDDVAFGPENIGIPSEEIRKRVDDSLRAVGMYENRKKGPHLLSGGQKQRVAIAGVLAMGPECIVFDEPTAMLDPKGRKEIMSIIEELHNQGKTIILITHFMEEALLADRVMVISKGKLVLDGSSKQVFRDKDKLKSLSLDLPFTSKLVDILNDKGMSIPDEIVTNDELIEYLCALKQNH